MTRLRLMTYNIRFGGRGHETEIIEVIRAAQTGVVLLQEVTDDAIAHLRPHAALEELHLDSCDQITDAVSGSLLQLILLKKLSLKNCSKLTDQGIDHLSTGLNHLKEIDLSGCPLISNQAVNRLKCKPFGPIVTK